MLSKITQKKQQQDFTHIWLMACNSRQILLRIVIIIMFSGQFAQNPKLVRKVIRKTTRAFFASQNKQISGICTGLTVSSAAAVGLIREESSLEICFILLFGLLMSPNESDSKTGMILMKEGIKNRKDFKHLLCGRGGLVGRIVMALLRYRTSQSSSRESSQRTPLHALLNALEVLQELVERNEQGWDQSETEDLIVELRITGECVKQNKNEKMKEKEKIEEKQEIKQEDIKEEIEDDEDDMNDGENILAKKSRNILQNLQANGFKEEKKMEKEQKRNLEIKLREYEEDKRISEEHARVAEQRAIVAEERIRISEVHVLELEQRIKVTEDRARDAEEIVQSAEYPINIRFAFENKYPNYIQLNEEDGRLCKATVKTKDDHLCLPINFVAIKGIIR
ncbi:MAG: hypothetical protein EZS28_040411, partial [Streblomastix strix]